MKKILITGAGTGLGRGTVIGLARAGHQVIATTEIWSQVTELRKHVEELGLQDHVTVDKLDVLDARDIAAVSDSDFDTFVSNAAIGDCGPLAEIPVELVRRTFETNVFANLELTQRVIRTWVDAGTAGRIVIVSSMGGMLIAFGLGPYCATKHALEAIAATLRDELTPTGITVQTINPGAYLTGFNDRIADTTFRWLDDAVNFNRTEDVKARFAEILADQYDPQDMIDKMVEIIGAEHGAYRNVWPPATEELIKQVQEAAWSRTV
ncbi:SDR family oxidoreductase [Streptomyces lunaelactis]|uniref:SDR family oxidoreductase n=1 Tax=Streptomyces lunaelactis TaxID=1535768 RepID=UPI001585A9A1|nr:SDR family oxidoreductase [Streptomyces lunaelactis]NUK01081.1 SDR family oxidoreductase [Streptomyces lunaelactis]NUK18038.1 SDR family oxidoreductase [Streptomyces lunaelactis]NUK25382.1 SDR family oxidoreductase [Streptomyces lunaelactis]NUK59254.1 SDR family oxidoreductase [Streptomyces lunaelactis]